MFKEQATAAYVSEEYLGMVVVVIDVVRYPTV
jgi:hypothetical protein